MSSLRRRPPLEDDDLLSEILLRLPPQPCSLPRASAVSKLWRSIASDPRFSRRFRAHHRRNPPLIGCFVKDFSHIHFQPAMEPPNRLPKGCFSFPLAAGDRFVPLGCRHGLALFLLSGIPSWLLVWDPVTGEQHRVDIPPGFDDEKNPISAAVFRAARDIHHFQVALVGKCERQDARAVASVYSSETGVWGNLISTQLHDSYSFPKVVYVGMPAVMIGNSLYWLLSGYPNFILEFDLAKLRLALIPMPVRPLNRNVWVTLAEGGGLGFIFLTGFCAQLWKRMTDCDGVGSWVLQRSIELDKLLSLNTKTESHPIIHGFAEDNNIMLLWTSSGISSVQLESLQFKKLYKSNICFRHYPYEAVYKGIDGGHDGAGLPQNT